MYRCYAHIILLFLILVGLKTNAQIKESHLYNPIGNSNSFGYAIIKRNLGIIKGVKSIKIPLVLEFNTDPRSNQFGFGKYWNLSLLKSQVLYTSPNSIEWVAPNGWSYNFFEKQNIKSKSNKTIFTERSGDWVCTIVTPQLTRIQATSDADLFFEYTLGYLTRFKLGNKQSVYKINYRLKNLVRSIVNQTQKTTLVEFIYSGNLISNIKLSNTTYKFAYIYKSINNTQDHIGLLSSIEYPNGDVEEFAYSSNNSYTREIIKKNFSIIKIPAIASNRITILKNKKEEGWIEWDEYSGFIIADNVGKYRVGNPLDKFNPENSNVQNKLYNRPRYITIEYLRKNKLYPKIWQYDWENLIEIWQNEDTGEIHRYSLIGAQGPNFLRMRKVEKYTGKNIQQDKKSWALEHTWSYDNTGKLIRVLYGNGDIYRMEYNKAGKEVRRFMNDTLIKENKYDVDGNLVSIWQIFKGKEYFSDYENGKRTTYYINNKLMKKVVYDAMGRISKEFYPNKRTISFVYNKDNTFYRIINEKSGKQRITKMIKLDSGGVAILFSKDQNGNERFYKHYFSTYGKDNKNPKIDDPKLLELFNQLNKK